MIKNKSKLINIYLINILICLLDPSELIAMDTTPKECPVNLCFNFKVLSISSHTFTESSTEAVTKYSAISSLDRMESLSNNITIKRKFLSSLLIIN